MGKIKLLEEDGKIFGILSDNDSVYIKFSETEIAQVVQLIEDKGRISRKDLVEEVSHII